METHLRSEMDGCDAAARRNGDRGAALVEYALLVGLIALVCFAAVVFFGNQTDDTLSRVSSSVDAA